MVLVEGKIVGSAGKMIQLADMNVGDNDSTDKIGSAVVGQVVGFVINGCDSTDHPFCCRLYINGDYVLHKNGPCCVL
jgi:hypothetical protein